MEKPQKHNKNTLQSLLTWMIIVSSITLALVLVVVVLTFVLVFSAAALAPAIVNVVVASFLVMSIVEIVCDVGLIVLIAIFIGFAAKGKGPNAKLYIITFAILLGIFVISWIISFFANVVATLQLADVIAILVFSCVYRSKIKNSTKNQQVKM